MTQQVVHWMDKYGALCGAKLTDEPIRPDHVVCNMCQDRKGRGGTWGRVRRHEPRPVDWAIAA